MTVALGLFVLTGCTKAPSTESTITTTTAPAATETVSSQKQIAVIETDKGVMKLELWSDVAPNTVANFVKLANEKFYEGTAFHRIIDGFMIQGGCPNTKVGAKGIPGTGDPGYKIKAEFNNRSHQWGVISMARSQHPDSAGSQFFICTGDASFLDGKYTAFGKLIEGDDVLRAISKTPVVSNGGEKSKPTERIEIKSVRIE